MPRRDLDTRNTVTNVVADTSSAQFSQAIADLGTQVIRQNQEAKINENLSQAQLQLNELDNQFRIENEGNPFNKEALENYKNQRNVIMNELGGDISPFFKRNWNEATRNLASRSDISLQAWGFRQARTNTINSINRSIKNNLDSAAAMGRSYAAGEITDVESFLNYEPARNSLQGFANRNLGTTTGTQLLESYNEDYIKSFLSGVGEERPELAVQLMEDKFIKDAVGDSRTFNKFKKAMGERALNLKNIQVDTLNLSILRDKNNLLSNSSLTEPVSYADLQKEFEDKNYPQATQDFFLRLNGYKTASGSTLDNSQKDIIKAELYTHVVDLARSENISTQDVSKMQDVIFDAMDKKAITRKEGLSFVNQLLEPLAEQKQSSLEAFSDGTFFFSDDIGFGGVQDYFEDNIEIQPDEDKDEEEVGPLAKSINNRRRIALFDNYSAALKRQADSRGIRVADITELEKPERVAIYRDAMQEAKEMFALDSFPTIRTLGDTPNSIITKEGKNIKIKEGKTKLEPDISIGDIKTVVEHDASGNAARIYYRNGVRVKAEMLSKDGQVLREVLFDANGEVAR